MTKLDKFTLEEIATRIAQVESKHYDESYNSKLNDVDIGKNMAYREIARIISSEIEHIKSTQKLN